MGRRAARAATPLLGTQRPVVMCLMCLINVCVCLFSGGMCGGQAAVRALLSSVLLKHTASLCVLNYLVCLLDELLGTNVGSFPYFMKITWEKYNINLARSAERC